MVERDGLQAPPAVSRGAGLACESDLPCGADLPRAARPYRAPTLTVYGTIRDLTRGTGIGKPDNPSSQTHAMTPPWGSGASPGYR